MRRHVIRRGKTIFLGRVSSEMLASCYDGAKVHALPSWYELPGLVSIEAAARKVPCVVTDYGTIRDYLGDNAYYCSPGDTHDIRDAVERAFLTPRSEALLADVSRFTWQNSALQMVPIYEEALSMEINYANLEKLKNFPFKGDKKGSVEELLKDYPALSGLIKEIR